MITKTDKVIESSEYMKDSKAIQTWIRIGNFSDNTGQGYTQGLKQYCTFHKMTPEALIEEAESQHALLPRQQNIILRLADFKNSISSKSPNTQKMHLAGVRSFYKNNYVIIPDNPNRDRAGSGTLKKNDWTGFNKETVRSCLKHLNVRDRAILLCIISSGMGRSEILNLKFEDMVNEDDRGITTLNIHRIKSGVNYITFFSPEATAALNSYLSMRGQRAKAKGLDDMSPYVFVTAYRKSFDQITPEGFNQIFLRLSDRMGEEFKTDKGTYNILRAHNFRKFFKSALQNSGLPEWQTEQMMGHTLSALDRAYFRADQDKMKENYIKHLNAVSVEMEIIEVSFEDSEEFKKLKAENLEIKTQMAAIQELLKLSAKYQM